MTLNTAELNQYTHQLNLDCIGITGQKKLKNTKVLCIGAGGLGSSMLLYLAAAGIGTIGIIDDDVVEVSNLHRQILYQHLHVGQPKATIAQSQLTALNPHINIQAFVTRINLENAKSFISQYDMIADCSDNFITHYLLNDVCFTSNKPLVFASISKLQGHCALFLGNHYPCYRCLFPFNDHFATLPDCNQDGVIGVLPGLLGIIQATEIIKWILNFKDTLAGRLLAVDIRSMAFKQYRLSVNKDCLLCALQTPLECLNRVEPLSNRYSISVKALRAIRNTFSPPILLDVRTLKEHGLYHIGGIVIPLTELNNRLTELNPAAQIIVYCQSGKRSYQAVQLLRAANFSNVQHLRGGLVAWKKYHIPAMINK